MTIRYNFSFLFFTTSIKI